MVIDTYIVNNRLYITGAFTGTFGSKRKVGIQSAHTGKLVKTSPIPCDPMTYLSDLVGKMISLDGNENLANVARSILPYIVRDIVQ